MTIVCIISDRALNGVSVQEWDFMKEIKGTVFVVISAVIFGFMPIAAKYLYAAGCNSASLTVYRYSLSLPLLLFLAVREQSGGGSKGKRPEVKGGQEHGETFLREAKLLPLKRAMHINTVQLKQFIVLSAGFCMTPLLLFASYNYISAGSATTIHFSYPVFVILASIFIFREKVSAMKKVGVAFCLTGLVLFYEPGQTAGTLGILLALASGVTYTFYMMFYDRSILKYMKPFKTNFYLSLFSAVLVFVFSLVTGSFVVLTTPGAWAMAAGFSFMLCVVACVLFQLGISLIGAQKSAVLSTFEPITSVILGVILFQEKVGVKTAVGVIFILAAVLCITFFDKGKA